MSGFLEDDPRVLDLLVVLVELSEVDPEAGELAHGLLRVDGLHGLGEGVDDLPGLVLQQVHPLLPLRHVVRVLPEQHGVQEQGTPGWEQVITDCQSPVRKKVFGQS